MVTFHRKKSLSLLPPDCSAWDRSPLLSFAKKYAEKEKARYFSGLPDDVASLRIFTLVPGPDSNSYHKALKLQAIYFGNLTAATKPQPNEITTPSFCLFSNESQPQFSTGFSIRTFS